MWPAAARQVFYAGGGGVLDGEAADALARAVEMRRNLAARYPSSEHLNCCVSFSDCSIRTPASILIYLS
jgi:hypothetical protein